MEHAVRLAGLLITFHESVIPSLLDAVRSAHVLERLTAGYESSEIRRLSLIIARAFRVSRLAALLRRSILTTIDWSVDSCIGKKPNITTLNFTGVTAFQKA